MLDACGLDGVGKWVGAINQWLNIASFCGLFFKMEPDSSNLEDFISLVTRYFFSRTCTSRLCSGV